MEIRNRLRDLLAWHPMLEGGDEMAFESDEHISASELKTNTNIVADILGSEMVLRVAPPDLWRLLDDNAHLRKQVRELQAKSTEQLEENRKLRRETEDSFDLFRSLDLLSAQVFEVSKSKGWHDAVVSVPTHASLLHSEISEMFEAFRNHKLHEHCGKDGLRLTCLQEELADVIIRSLDFAAEYGVDIGEAVRKKHEYNKQREWRHGNKAA